MRGCPRSRSLMPTATAASAPPAVGHVPLTLVTRGGAVESVHTGSVAVVDADGRVLLRGGRSGVPDVHAQRAEAAAGAAVRRGRRRRALRLLAAAGRAAVREPLGRAAARRGGRATCWPRAGNTAADLQCGTHAPGVLRGARRGRRRRRRIRRSRTTARASTAECSRIARPCGYTKDDYLAFDHPLQQAIRAAVAHFTGVPEDAARRRHRRLLGAELRGSARQPRAGVRAPRRAAPTTPDYGQRAAHARRRDDRAPGDGVGRERQRPRADARRARRLGHQDRRRGRAGDRHPQPRLGHRGQGGRRQRRAACTRRRSPCSTSSACSTRTRARALAPWAPAAARATTAASSPARSRPAVVLDKAARRLASAPGACRRNELNAP